MRDNGIEPSREQSLRITVNSLKCNDFFFWTRCQSVRLIRDMPLSLVSDASCLPISATIPLSQLSSNALPNYNVMPLELAIILHG